MVRIIVSACLGTAVLGSGLLAEWLGNPPIWVIIVVAVVVGVCYLVALVGATMSGVSAARAYRRDSRSPFPVLDGPIRRDGSGPSPVAADPDQPTTPRIAHAGVDSEWAITPADPDTPALFGRARFRNVHQSLDAEGLNAQVYFYAKDDSRHTNVLYQMDGRWADYASHGSKNPEQIDLAPGRTALLDLVAKYRADEKCYPHNSRSLVRAPDARDPRLVLDQPQYEIKVELRGRGLAENLYLILHNEGAGRDFRLQVLHRAAANLRLGVS